MIVLDGELSLFVDGNLASSAVNDHSIFESIFGVLVVESDVVLNASLESANCFTVNSEPILSKLLLLLQGIDALVECLLISHHFNIIGVSGDNTVLRISRGDGKDFWLLDLWDFDVINDDGLVIANLFSLNNVLVTLSIFDMSFEHLGIGSFHCVNF